MSSSTTKDDEDRYTKMPIFTGEKIEYRDFMLIFEGWEDKEDIRRATSQDTVADLPTDEEYWSKLKERETFDMNGDVMQQVDALMEEEEQLYKDNTKSRSKLMIHVHKDLLQPMLTAGGEKKSVWLMKQWFKENFGEIEVEESLQDLTREFNELNPGDFDSAMMFIGKIDSVNARLGKIDATGKYKHDELQLIMHVLAKLPDNKDGKTNEKWAPFQAEYRKAGKMTGTTWLEFKTHLTREWKHIGTPKGGK